MRTSLRTYVFELVSEMCRSLVARNTKYLSVVAPSVILELGKCRLAFVLWSFECSWSNRLIYLKTWSQLVDYLGKILGPTSCLPPSCCVLGPTSCLLLSGCILGPTSCLLRLCSGADFLSGFWGWLPVWCPHAVFWGWLPVWVLGLTSYLLPSCWVLGPFP